VVAQPGHHHRVPDRYVINLETSADIQITFERKLTFEHKQETVYTDVTVNGLDDLNQSRQIGMLFSQFHVDMDLLRQRIEEGLKEQTQTALSE